MARLRRARDRIWSPLDRAVVIAVLALAMGSLFLTTYTLALGDPVPRRIDAALVGDPATNARTIDAVQQVADGSLDFRRYASPAAARQAIDLQRVYTALDLRAVASFASIMSVLIGRWAIVPTWLFFVVLGNSSSGGAVSPPLLPPPFAFVSQWLPSGATVTSLRNAIYFPGYEHARPIVVLMGWAAGLFVVMLAVSQRRRASPGAG